MVDSPEVWDPRFGARQSPPTTPPPSAALTSGGRAALVGPAATSHGATLSPAYIAAAQAAQQKSGVPASVTLAQLLLESHGVEDMPPDSYNAFGVKASNGYPWVRAWTQEYVPGQGLVHELKHFRKYDSLADAFDDHARLLATSPRYAGVRATVADGVNDKSADAYANALTDVYASAPNYGATLIALMREHNLYQYNKPLLQAPISPGGSRDAAPMPSGARSPAVAPHADLSPPLQDASPLQGRPSLMGADQPQLPPQPSAPDLNGQPQPQGALNAAPPQGGLPTGLGDYLYGPGAPAVGHAGPTPLGALALNARPPGQGVLNAPPMLAAQSGMGADVADPDALTLGPENAAILSRLLAKPSPQMTEPLKPTNVMLADALRALAPSDPSAGKALNGALSAPNPPAAQTALAQGPLNPAGQAAQAQNPLVAALMAMRPGGSIGPTPGGPYPQA